MNCYIFKRASITVSRHATRTFATGLLFLNPASFGACRAGLEGVQSELSAQRDGTPYPLYGLTSSSPNTADGRGTPTANRFRAINATYHKRNFSFIEADRSSAYPAISHQIQDLENQKTRETDPVERARGKAIDLDKYPAGDV
jgi:hypothetical protein